MRVLEQVVEAVGTPVARAFGYRNGVIVEDEREPGGVALGGDIRVARCVRRRDEAER
jgi:hypothetical protein